MSYSTVEKAKCAAWYEYTQSIVTVQRKFRREFNHDPPSARSIRTWHASLLQRGSVLPHERQRRRQVRTEQTVGRVEELFQNSPHMSTRRAAGQLGISRRTIQRILHDLHWHPYKLHVVQELSAEDCENRIAFAQDELDRIEQNPHHLASIAFSDEAHFHLDGVVNRHNFRYWSPDNPHWTAEQSLHSPRTTAWAAMWENGILGPFFFDDNVTSESYLHMLMHRFWPAVQSLGVQQQLIFMQDGAPPHWGRAVRQWLNDHFPGRWMGRGSANMPWPPRSPDLTPCDYFLWGFIKSKVYVTQPADIPELKRRIRRAFRLITADMRHNVMLAYRGRLQHVLENRGAHVEVLTP